MINTRDAANLTGSDATQRCQLASGYPTRDGSATNDPTVLSAAPRVSDCNAAGAATRPAGLRGLTCNA